MATLNTVKVAAKDIAPNRKRGGDLRALLTSKTVGAASGFMGVGTLEVGEFVTEHYHPYSEEFIYVVRGHLRMRMDGDWVPLEAGDGLLIPINVRHRLENDGDEQAFLVYHLGPLAPRPDMGHVDTEPYPEPSEAPTSGTGA